MKTDPQEFGAYYASLYPDRTGVTISDFAHLSSGWESDIIAFSAQWHSPEGEQREDLVLRVYGTDAGKKAQEEFQALRGLALAGYPVPRVDRLELDERLENRPFLIMERVNGKPLWPIMFQGDATTVQSNIDLFCGLMVRLHTLEWRAYAEHPEVYAPEGLIDQVFATWRPFIEAMPESGFMPVWKWIEEHRASVTPMEAAVVHWDFHPYNILVDEQGKATVLDWTSLAITDPRFDIAWTLILMLPYEGAAWRGRMLESYQRQRGMTIPDMEFFEVVSCLRRLVSVYISLTQSPEVLGMREGAQEQMRQQMSGVRGVAEILYVRTGLRVPEVEALFADGS